ncbi:MAG: TIM44-like domain-containing protein [Nitrospira sp.]
MNTTKLIAACIVCALIGTPTLSFAKARAGGGGYSSGSRSSGTSSSVGSRGSRTYDQNGAKPIEQSTAAKPAATAPPSTTAGPAPAAQPNPSFLQRNPLLSGIAAGVAGSWIGHMLFGATETSAKTTEAGEADQTAGGPNFMGILLLMLVVGGGLYYFLKVRRTPVPVLSGLNRHNAVSGSLLAEPTPLILRTAAREDSAITSADKTAFQHLLVDIQTAWSTQDLTGLRRCVTPEMLAYFSTALAEQTSQEVENHVDDVVLVQAEVQETWTEDATQYATAQLCWTARDYTLSLTKQRGEPGYLVEGSEEKPSETTEVWTFMRYQNGKWLLSAIQQTA